MKKALKIVAVVLGLLLFLGGVLILIMPREKLLSYITPDVRYVTVTNAQITDTTATMDVQLEVTSKLLPVFVDSLVYDFRLFNQSVAEGNQKFDRASKTGKVQKLAIPVSLDIVKARELVQRQMAEGKKIRAHVEAYCIIPVVGVRRIDIDREVDMTIPLPGSEIVPVSFPEN